VQVVGNNVGNKDKAERVKKLSFGLCSRGKASASETERHMCLITLAPHRPHSNCLRSFLFWHQSLVPCSFSLNRPRYTSRIQFLLLISSFNVIIGSSSLSQPPVHALIDHGCELVLISPKLVELLGFTPHKLLKLKLVHHGC